MRIRFLLFLSVLFLLQSCGSKKRIVNKKNPGVVIVEPEPVELPSVNQKEIIKKLERKNPNLNKYTLAYIKK